MGVVSGDCCGMARYQTVMSIGEPGGGTKQLLTPSLLRRHLPCGGRHRALRHQHRQHLVRVSPDISTLPQYLHNIYTISTLYLFIRELRAPMVTNMRGIAPKQPEDVKLL